MGPPLGGLEVRERAPGAREYRVRGGGGAAARAAGAGSLGAGLLALALAPGTPLPAGARTGALLAALAGGAMAVEALLSPAAESVVVFSGLGVQLESRGRFGGVRREFLELEQIEAAVINEGVTATAVLPYLCFLVRGSERLSVAFPDLRPGVSLKVLREVRRGVCDALEGVRSPEEQDAAVRSRWPAVPGEGLAAS